MSLLLDYLSFFTSAPGLLTITGIASGEAFGTAHLTDAGVGNATATNTFGGRGLRPIFGTPSRILPVIGGRGRGVR